MSGARRFVSVASLVVLVSVTAGCVEINPFESASPNSQTQRRPDDVNDADIAFLKNMIAQLERGQSLTNPALAPDAEVSEDVSQVARHIAEEDRGRITKLSDLLDDWGEARARQVAVATRDELRGLERADFDEQWIALMIEHHEQASALAEQVQRDGSSRAVNNFASGMIVDLEFETSALGGR